MPSTQCDSVSEKLGMLAGSEYVYVQCDGYVSRLPGSRKLPTRRSTKAVPLGRLVQPWPQVGLLIARHLCICVAIWELSHSHALRKAQTDFCKSNCDLVTFKIYKLRAYLFHSEYSNMTNFASSSIFKYHPVSRLVLEVLLWV